MATYIMLNRFTPQGVANVKQSPARIDALKQTFRANGAEIKQAYLAMGRYDTVLVFEARDDETCARLCLTIAAAGNVQSETLRAFTEDEFKKIVAALP
ncbi:MAG: GYD domain-containing protein [Candidatus Binataceae bacterium]